MIRSVIVSSAFLLQNDVCSPPLPTPFLSILNRKVSLRRSLFEGVRNRCTDIVIDARRLCIPVNAKVDIAGGAICRRERRGAGRATHK